MSASAYSHITFWRSLWRRESSSFIREGVHREVSAPGRGDARKAGADILLFGHTHRAYCQQLEDGLWVMNPGTSRSSYGTILIEGGEIQCSLTRLI